MKKILLILLLGLLVPLAQGRRQSNDKPQRACFISSTYPNFPKNALCTDTCKNMCEKRTDDFTSPFTKSDYEIYDGKTYHLEVCFCRKSQNPTAPLTPRGTSNDEPQRACFISSTDPDYPKKNLCTDTCQNMCKNRTDGFTSTYTKKDYEVYGGKTYYLEVCFCRKGPPTAPF